MSGEVEDPRAILEGLRGQIRDLLGKMYRQRSQIQEEISKAEHNLQRVEAALLALADHRVVGSSDERLTIKEGVLKVLGTVAPRGLTALGILERLRTDLDMDYPRTSLSPQLSRLKAGGQVRLERGQWFLATTENGPGA